MVSSGAGTRLPNAHLPRHGSLTPATPPSAPAEVAPAGSPVVAAPGANTARFCPLGSAMSVESAPVAGFKRPRACAPCPDVDGDEWVMPADPWHAVFDSTAKR